MSRGGGLKHIYTEWPHKDYHKPTGVGGWRKACVPFCVACVQLHLSCLHMKGGLTRLMASLIARWMRRDAADEGICGIYGVAVESNEVRGGLGGWSLEVGGFCRLRHNWLQMRTRVQNLHLWKSFLLQMRTHVQITHAILLQTRAGGTFTVFVGAADAGVCDVYGVAVESNEVRGGLGGWSLGGRRMTGSGVRFT